MPCDHYIVHYILICSLISFFLGVLISNNHRDKNNKDVINTLPFFSAACANADAEQKNPFTDETSRVDLPVWECVSASKMNLKRASPLLNMQKNTMSQRVQLKSNLIF